jgi:transcriptional regulator with XRE-family HTH domain
MKDAFDIGDFVNISTQQSVTYHLIERVKKRRKELKLSRKELSIKSGVSYASLRRFETSGEISLASLMKIAQTLGCLDDFDLLFKRKIVTDLKDFNV